MMSRRAMGQFYADFASAVGTSWLMVIVLAMATSGRIGRWGAWILPFQIMVSLAFALLRAYRKRHSDLRETANPTQLSPEPRFVPV